MLGKGDQTIGGLKGLLLTIGTCIAVLSAPGCATTRAKRDTAQSQTFYALALGNFENHRAEAAIEELQRAINADPENADAYNLFGLVALKQAYDYGAQAEIHSCLKGTEAELVRAEQLRSLKQAETQFRKAVEVRPNFAEAWNNISVVSLLMQAWDQAIASAEKALSEPTYDSPVLARANLGWAYFHKKDQQRAWKELHEAVTRAPGFCVGRYRLAKLYLERGDVERAIEVITPLLADSKRCPVQEAFLLGGLLYERRKDREKAQELFRVCAEMSSRSCAAEECRRYAQMIQ
jgi:type IV pilus assembly protein PilF